MLSLPLLLLNNNLKRTIVLIMMFNHPQICTWGTLDVVIVLKSFNYEFKFICTMIQYEIFLLLTYLFRLCQVFIAGGLFSSCGQREQLSSCGMHTSHCSNFSCCRGHVGFRTRSTLAQQLWLPGFRPQAQQFWCMGLAAQWHVGSSQTRDGTLVSCIGRWILYY